MRTNYVVVLIFIFLLFLLFISIHYHTQKQRENERKMVENLVLLKTLFVFVFSVADPFLYHEETLELMMHRWTKLEKVRLIWMGVLAVLTRTYIV